MQTAGVSCTNKRINEVETSYQPKSGRGLSVDQHQRGQALRKRSVI